jgi:hypothetical protein
MRTSKTSAEAALKTLGRNFLLFCLRYATGFGAEAVQVVGMDASIAQITKKFCTSVPALSSAATTSCQDYGQRHTKLHAFKRKSALFSVACTPSPGR